VTFGAVIAGKHGIYSIPEDGSGKAELLLATGDRVRPTSWSPDGKALVYSTAGTDKKTHLWVLPVEAGGGAPSGPGAARGKPYPLHDTAFSEDEGEVSPDGRWLAYTSEESGAPEVYVQPFSVSGPGGKVRISTDGGQSPRWSKNGRELFYWDGTRSKAMAVDVETTPQFRVGIPNQLFAHFGRTTWDVAPDGKRFLFEQDPSLESGVREMAGVVDWFEELRRRVPAGK
jgi:Tol biopolymer transport system component